MTEKHTTSRAGSAGVGKPKRKVLAPSQKYEVFTSVLMSRVRLCGRGS